MCGNIKKDFNPLAATEMSGESNYNCIDGVLNNDYKPSIIEKLKEYNNNPDEFYKDNNRKPILTDR